VGGHLAAVIPRNPKGYVKMSYRIDSSSRQGEVIAVHNLPLPPSGGVVAALLIILGISIVCAACVLSVPAGPQGRRALIEHATVTAPSRINLQSASEVLRQCEEGKNVAGMLVSFGGKITKVYSDQVWLDNGVVVENLGGRTPYVGEILTGEGTATGCTNGYLLVQANVRAAE